MKKKQIADHYFMANIGPGDNDYGRKKDPAEIVAAISKEFQDKELQEAIRSAKEDGELWCKSCANSSCNKKITGASEIGCWTQVYSKALLALHELTRPRVVADGELPEKEGPYLTRLTNTNIGWDWFSLRNGGRWDRSHELVTHWWPLPEVGE